MKHLIFPALLGIVVHPLVGIGFVRLSYILLLYGITFFRKNVYKITIYYFICLGCFSTFTLFYSIVAGNRINLIIENFNFIAYFIAFPMFHAALKQIDVTAVFRWFHRLTVFYACVVCALGGIMIFFGDVSVLVMNQLAISLNINAGFALISGFVPFVNLPNNILLFPMIYFVVFFHPHLLLILLVCCAVFLTKSKILIAFLVLCFLFKIFNTYFLIKLTRMTILRAAFALLCFLGLCIYLVDYFSFLLWNFSDFFNGSLSANIKLEQFSVLSEGISSSPLFGQGVGAVIENPTVGYYRQYQGRNYYENEFVYWIFQYGLIGTLCLIFLYMYYIVVMFAQERSRSSFLFFFSISFLSLGTNPYLSGTGTILVILAWMSLSKVSTRNYLPKG